MPPSSPIAAATERGSSTDRRPFHDDEARSLQVLHESLGHDRSHHLAGVVDPLAAAVAKREGERAGEVFGAGGREAVGVRDRQTLPPGREQDKNEPAARDIAIVSYVWGSYPRSAFIGHPEQLCGLDVQRICELSHDLEARIKSGLFQLTEIAPADFGLVGEVVLRKSLRIPQAAEIAGEHLP
jgi:hypothetical protein